MPLRRALRPVGTDTVAQAPDERFATPFDAIGLYADGAYQWHSRRMTERRCSKLETFNPGNSIKDRIAVKMIDDAERLGS